MSFRTRLLIVLVSTILIFIALPRASEAVHLILAKVTRSAEVRLTKSATIASPNVRSPAVLTTYTSARWYNGDASLTSALPNGITFTGPDGRVFSDFNVTDANGWEVSALLSNNLMSVTITQASYEIRTGVSNGNGGTLLHSGTAAATQVATGRTLGGFTEYTVMVSGLNIHLAPGTYFLNVAPIGPGSGVSYNTATTGTNAVGSPPGNNANEFWKTPTSNYGSTSGQGNDFSNGVIGNITIPCIAPAITYVDDSWVGTPTGNDPDGAGPATYFGCDSFATIQGGVTGVATGGQVIVASGTYNEAQILILRSMTVTGAGAATTIINGGNTAISVAGLVRIVTPLGDTGSVTLSGFTITNPGLSGETGGTHVTVYARPLDAAATTTVSNNTILGVNASDNGVYTIRNVGSVVYHHNVFTNQAFNPIVIERAGGPTDVHHNTISANGSTAYFNFTYAATNVTSLQRVADNTINGSTAAAIAFNSAYPAAPPFTGTFTNISIVNNTITNLAGGMVGITLSNRAVSGNGLLGNIVNPAISRNIITGVDAVGSQGIRLSGLVTNASITGNDVRHLERSFDGRISTDHSPTGTQAHINNFVNNAGGFVNDGTETLNAENNWWGCNAGPGNTGCDPVTSLVDFEPWLVLGVSAVPSTIIAGTTSNATADMTHNSAAEDKSKAGTVPQIPVAFSATEGTMTPTTGTITDGQASSMFTSTSTNSGTACATVDNQLTCTNITVTSPANVSGTKTKSGGTAPDSTITYTVVLSNSSASVQLNNPGDEFADVLPSSLTLVSASASSGTALATVGTNTVTWNGSIAGNGSVTITITATINNVSGGTVVSNQGTINYDADGNGTNEASRMTDDPSVGGASDPTSFTVFSPSGVSGTKTKSGGSAPASTLTYTVVLSNSNATPQFDNSGDEFADVLPSSLTLVSASASSGTALATVGTNTVTWNGSIGGDSSVTITITATINNVPGGTVVSNQGTINYDADGNGTNEASRLTDDPAVEGASDPTNFAVSSPSGVSGTKTKSGGTAPNSTITYTVVLSNSNATPQFDNPGNEFADVLPSSLTLVSASASSGTALATVGTNTVIWNGSIAGDSSVTITITATINNVPGGTVVSNQGTINYDADGNGTNEASRLTDDPAVDGASDPTSFAVSSPSGISGTKTKSGGTAPASTITYTVVLSNSTANAQFDNPGDEFADVLPSSLTLVSATATSGTALANVGTNTVTWNGSIAGNGSATITITATINNVPGGTVVSNQGTINYDADGNGTNEASRLTDDPAVEGASNPTSFAVSSPSGVTGTKTKSGGTAPNSTIAYTVVLSNSSATAQFDNPGDEFADVLPSSLTLVSTNATSGTALANVGTNTVTWNGSIAGNGSATITITATVNNVPGGTVVSNQGTINYDADGNGTNESSRMTDDPSVGGASDPTNFTVLAPADVSGRKTKSGGVKPGETVSYSVVLSNTGSFAQQDNPGTEFTDILPSSLTLVSASATSGAATANVGTKTVSWSGSIAANDSVTITITATINGVANGTVVSNQGTIKYDADGDATNEATRLTDDPAVGGGSDPTNFTTVADSDLTITKSHTGDFSGGQVGASYTITVTNLSTGPTTGPVTVTDTVPVGLTPTGPNGEVDGWSCSISGQTVTCTRSDVLAGSSSYPAISLTVNVANPAPVNVTNTATVSGDGETNTGNNTASDSTNIECSQNFVLNNTNPLMISRFRMNGPAGPQDEYVEIFNPSTTPHTVASGICGDSSGGYGVYASAGNGTTSNTATLVCYIPNGTVIPAGGYYLCTGVTYSLNNLGRNGGAAGATATGDAAIGCGGSCGANIPDDAGLVLLNQSVDSLFPNGGFNALSDPGVILYDKLGFEPYGAAAPASTYPSQAATYCEGGSCLKPVGDASTGAACANPTGQFPVFPVPPACYGLAGQYGFVRRQTSFDFNLGTLHQDTNSNGSDFLMVTPNPATNMGVDITAVFGVSGVLGASGPYNTNAPPDVPAVKLTRTPFDGSNQSGPLNLERRYIPDPTIANPANNPLGTLTLRYKYTNNSGSPINGLRFEVDNLSTLCGPQTTLTVATGDARNVGSSPNCGAGAFTAIFKVLNSTSQIVVDSSSTARNVYGTVLEDLSVGGAPGAGPLSPNGGGLYSTYIINPSTANASVGDGVTGGVGTFATTVGTTDPARVIRVQVKFGVVKNGRFILLLVPMAKSSPAP